MTNTQNAATEEATAPKAVYYPRAKVENAEEAKDALNKALDRLPEMTVTTRDLQIEAEAMSRLSSKTPQGRIRALSFSEVDCTVRSPLHNFFNSPRPQRDGTMLSGSF